MRLTGTLFEYPDLVFSILSRPQFKGPGSGHFFFGVFDDKKSVANPEPVKDSQE
jgi:hypothetical protein